MAKVRTKALCGSIAFSEEMRIGPFAAVWVVALVALVAVSTAQASGTSYVGLGYATITSPASGNICRIENQGQYGWSWSGSYWYRYLDFDAYGRDRITFYWAVWMDAGGWADGADVQIRTYQWDPTVGYYAGRGGAVLEVYGHYHGTIFFTPSWPIGTHTWKIYLEAWAWDWGFKTCQTTHIYYVFNS